MKNEKAPFMSVSDDLDDRLEALARGKGVGELVRTAPAPSNNGEGARPVQRTIAPPAPAPVPETPQPAPVSTGSLGLPNYVWTDLKVRAAKGDGTVRYIIMQALRAYGITIDDIDMVEDGRRLRGSKQG